MRTDSEVCLIAGSIEELLKKVTKRFETGQALIIFDWLSRTDSAAEGRGIADEPSNSLLRETQEMVKWTEANCASLIVLLDVPKRKDFTSEIIEALTAGPRK